jgi:spore germination cell wall hydrolase CwlJ-like protein
MNKILITLFTLLITLSTPTQASSKTDEQCLAYNIYYEANNQDLSGRIAVANVTINRKNNPQFPNSICGVVYDKSKRVNGSPYCEFSWAKVGIGNRCYASKHPYKSSPIYKDILELSKILLSTNISDDTKGALFYHADYINGGWFKRNLTYTVQIGTHKFYK